MAEISGKTARRMTNNRRFFGTERKSFRRNWTSVSIRSGINPSVKRANLGKTVGSQNRGE